MLLMVVHPVLGRLEAAAAVMAVFPAPAVFIKPVSLL
jgi:hypothetical protein